MQRLLPCACICAKVTLFRGAGGEGHRKLAAGHQPTEDTLELNLPPSTLTLAVQPPACETINVYYLSHSTRGTCYSRRLTQTYFY